VSPFAEIAAIAGNWYVAPVDEFDAAAGWSGGPAVLPRIGPGITVTRVYDGSGGFPLFGRVWVQPSSTANIGVGHRLTDTTTGETLTVEEVHRTSAQTTISQIIYETYPVNSGDCWISPTIPLDELEENALIQVSGNVSGATTEYRPIKEIVRGADGRTSFRINLSGTHTSGDNIQASGVLSPVITRSLRHPATRSLRAASVGTSQRQARTRSPKRSSRISRSSPQALARPQGSIRSKTRCTSRSNSPTRLLLLRSG
jgi:hypothetical protein